MEILKTQPSSEPQRTHVTVNPGVCGFTCVVEAEKQDARTVTLNISGSDCKHIQRLSELITVLTLVDIFKPISKNLVYISAEKAGCHPSCVIPVAIMKAAEAALGMALPRDVHITFAS